MGLKPVVGALAGAVLLAAGSFATADEYRADEFFGLDLSKAVLSPRRLGPPAEFAPVAVEARGDTKGDTRIEPRKVAVENIKAAPRHIAAHVSEKPKGAARTKLAHRHRNPLDAQAMDTRVQKWPCRSGGICNWKQ